MSDPRPRSNRSLLLAAVLILSLGFGVTTGQAAVDDQQVLGSWRPVNGVVYDLARVGGTVIVAGSFTAFAAPDGRTVGRAGLAALGAGGQLLPWNPGVKGTVQSIAVTADRRNLAVGGLFSAIGGQERRNFAVVSLTGGTAVPIRADTDGEVLDTAVIGDRVFLVGRFQHVKGAERGRGAALLLSTGGLTAWDPQADRRIWSVAASSRGLVIGGAFEHVRGIARDYTALVDGAGVLLPWRSHSTCPRDPANPCVVFDVVPVGDVIYEGVGGPGGRIVSLDARTGSERWVAATDGDVVTVTLAGSVLYAGGHFRRTVARMPRAGLAALDAGSGAVLPSWAARVTGGEGVWVALAHAGGLAIGGEFTRVGSRQVSRLASFPSRAGVHPAPPPDAVPVAKPGRVRKLKARGTRHAVVIRWKAPRSAAKSTRYLVRVNPKGPSNSRKRVIKATRTRMAPFPKGAAKVMVRARTAAGAGPAVTRRVRIGR